MYIVYRWEFEWMNGNDMDLINSSLFESHIWSFFYQTSTAVVAGVTMTTQLCASTCTPMNTSYLLVQCCRSILCNKVYITNLVTTTSLPIYQPVGSLTCYSDPLGKSGSTMNGCVFCVVSWLQHMLPYYCVANFPLVCYIHLIECEVLYYQLATWFLVRHDSVLCSFWTQLIWHLMSINHLSKIFAKKTEIFLSIR